MSEVNSANALIRFQHRGKSRSFLKYLEQRALDGRSLTLENLWDGHDHVFRVPGFVLSYCGTTPAHTALMLASQAQGHSYHTASEHNVVVKAAIRAKAVRSNLSYKAVQSSFLRLEKDGLICRTKRRTPKGRHAATSISFTDKFRHKDDFILIPLESLNAIDGMENAAEKAVYVAALYLATKGLAETVYVKKQEWRKLSGLGKNAFNRGVKYCATKRLLTFASDVLTVNDASTGKPTVQWQRPKVWSGEPSPTWEVDFDTVTSDQWEQLLYAEFGTDAPHRCPQCGNHKRFSVGISKKVFGCFNCGTRGTLAEFMRLHHGFDWAQIRRHIAEQLRKLEVTV